MKEDKSAVLKKIGFQDVYDEDEDGFWGLSDKWKCYVHRKGDMQQYFVLKGT